ncbi:MAG: AraC family ligand binding domain-containing protein, partial [Rhizobacter sp.]|nr:AraC family ligand binding domain-containing protein [Chlorobiales bacterium]
MPAASALTLVNEFNGHLAFKMYAFENASLFDHIQRHNYFSVLWIKTGSGKLRINFSEYDLAEETLIFSAPYEPFMISAGKGEAPLTGKAIHFHPDFFCVLKHQREINSNGILFNN